ncbi:hypothetical protein IRZ53_14380 [Pseudomonas fulva]|uniref:hypothetical protein n=1 Tax=Pseudomonas fulva TaxID=47880 RepID=UPI0018AACC6A|nr:hypothetical protein [Pseudomonas fulva]MBF8674002.1 hypothetical protein [Pseudomonas fulva]MBF8697976.1 hypothetical protein [Pseudomonas fulva]
MRNQPSQSSAHYPKYDSGTKSPVIAYVGMNLNDLSDDCVISYTIEGLPVLLENMNWDFPKLALVPTDSTSFNFGTYISDASHNSENIRACQYLLATNIFSLGHSGRALRISTIGLSNKALRALTKCADKRNITIQELISSPKHIDFTNEISANHASLLSKILRDYLRLTANQLNLKPHKSIFKKLSKRHETRYKSGKQTPVIPSRILHARYHHYNDIVHNFIENSDKIKALVEKLSNDPLYGRAPSKSSRTLTFNEQSLRRQQVRTNFASAVTEHELDNYFKEHAILSATNITSHLSLVQHSAKCLVHIYTLVRDHEAKLLEDECIQPAEGWNSKGLYMMGVSTKLTGAVKDTAWIANELIVEPIKALQLLKEMIAPYVPKNTPGSECLIITPTFLPFCNTKPGKTVIPSDSTRYEKYLPPMLIVESDILELEAIDPLADWRSDPKYKVGNPWKIASHQFRRTMAVFGAQSLVLDIPELKRLLTHLTESMSIYYQRGCSAGGYNMNMKSPELSNEFKTATNDAKWISYLNEVLYSTEKLYGGHGERVTPMSKMDDRDRIIYRQTAEETMQKAKKGLISYQRTPLGGCTSNKPCNERAHGNFTNCFGCASSVLKVSNVESVIEHAKIDILDLDPQSFEYRMEQRNIQDYEAILSHLN